MPRAIVRAIARGESDVNDDATGDAQRASTGEGSDPSSKPTEEGIYPVGKAVLGIVWLLATACFFPPLETSDWGGLGRTLFGVLAAVHLVECVAFLGVLKRSPRPLVYELWQTFLFGIVHVSIVRRELEAAEPSTST